MSTVWIIILIAALVIVASSISFLIGRDTGEAKQYNVLLHANERLIKENLDLKWENNRIARSMQYYDDGVLSRILKEMDEGKTFGYGSYPDSE